MTQSAGDDELLQFLGRRGHILEALPELHDREVVVLQVRSQLGGVPAIDGHFAYL